MHTPGNWYLEAKKNNENHTKDTRLQTLLHTQIHIRVNTYTNADDKTYKNCDRDYLGGARVINGGLGEKGRILVVIFFSFCFVSICFVGVLLMVFV